MDTRTFPTASVIVVGYNNREHLDACLGSLMAQDYPAAYQILFIDNASADESADYVRSRFPSVQVIDSGTNLGYAGGNNLGAGLASGEVLAFLNPDTCVERDWLRELVYPLVSNPAVGLTTSKIVLMDQPDRVNTCGNMIGMAGLTTCRRAGDDAASIVADEDVPAVSGAAFAIWAWLFRQLGGFDERFWMYLEDTDLSWRARLAGYRCLVAARSVVKHEYVLALSPGKTFQVERNRYQMLAKNLSAWALVALAPQIALGEVVTWCWALLNGPRHLWAKFLATAWVIIHLLSIVRAHRATQRLRRVPDALLLRRHEAVPPIGDVADGAVARVAAAVVIPAAAVLAGLGMWLTSVPFGHETSGAGWTDERFEPSEAGD